MFKYFITKLREYIFIILTATIFSISFFSESFSKENVFVIDNVKIETQVGTNFSREKYINKAFLYSFDILMSKILLTEDSNKLNNVKLNQIKILVNSFQIIEETYRHDMYKATFKIFYNDRKVKKFLVQKNISYSEPKKISAVFFPILFVNDKMKNFNENFFYNKWNKIQIENEVINFVLPLDDLDDFTKITEIKNNIEQLDINSLVNKYNIDNYVFALMNYENNKLKIYLKTNFEDNNVSKNFSYDLENFNDDEKLNFILKDLKTIITDLWKGNNLVNLLMPLSINVQFKHENLKDLDNLKNALNKVTIINNFDFVKFSINNSDFKIYYYGNPKNLKSELLYYGYNLRNDSGYWEITLND